MSKLAARMPDLAEAETRMEIATSVLEALIGDAGRVNKADLVDGVFNRIENIPTDEALLLSEGRRHVAEQLVQGWSNRATIKYDRNQRAPVYQTAFGFSGSFFKVGSEFVQPQAMTVQDFEVMLDRIDHRIENAQTDRSILADFFERARPGLEAGQNLVEQFDAGTLELVSVNGTPAIEPGDDES